MRKIISALAGLLLCALVIPAQGQTLICFKSGSGSGCTPVSAANPLPMTFTTAVPAGATQLTGSGTGTTAATTATLAGTSGKTTYICGFTISSTATAGITGTATVTGTITGTLSFVQGVGTSPAVSTLTVPLAPCVPASAANTDIVVHSVAASTGGVTSVVANGYQL
jgi:hypothetical protein